MLKTKEWTVMIYMAGDNNLSVDMAYALEELEKKVVVNQNDKINLFVHYENNSPEIPALYCDFSDANNPIYQYSTEIQTKYSVNNANSDAVAPVVDFVDWCSKQGGDSDRHALIFSGHTMGFLSMGLFKDESKNVSMTMPALQEGLETITTKIIGKKLSILGFDSCVMSMFEVGQQFTDVAETMIASEGSIPNAGWSYAEILSTLANAGSDVKQVASEFVRRYIQKQSKYAIGGVSVDMAAWDLSKMGQLNGKFHRLTQTLLKCFEDETSVVYKQMKRVLLQVHFNSQSYMHEQCLDLGDFCSLLIEEIASVKEETGHRLHMALLSISDASKSVLEEISKCVILSGFSGGTYQYSTGISLFFPWSLSAYSVSITDYEQLQFVKNTKAGTLWNEFLHKYLCEVTRRKSKEINQEQSFNPHQMAVSHYSQNAVAHETPLNSFVKTPMNPFTRTPMNPFTRTPMNPFTRTPMNPFTRTPMNPFTRTPMNPFTRTPMNPFTRTPMNPFTRTPMNPFVRMAGDSSRFFEQFTVFKNIEARWDVMGYTKQ